MNALIKLCCPFQSIHNFRGESMKNKLIMTLSILSILGCCACSEDDSGVSSSRSHCSFESPFCEGNILHTCVNGIEQLETCSNQCSAEAGKCIDSSPPGQNCDAGKHYDEAPKGHPRTYHMGRITAYTLG